jgi:hypothetical protein
VFGDTDVYPLSRHRAGQMWRRQTFKWRGMLGKYRDWRSSQMRLKRRRKEDTDATLGNVHICQGQDEIGNLET